MEISRLTSSLADAESQADGPTLAELIFQHATRPIPQDKRAPTTALFPSPPPSSPMSHLPRYDEGTSSRGGRGWERSQSQPPSYPQQEPSSSTHVLTSWRDVSDVMTALSGDPYSSTTVGQFLVTRDAAGAGALRGRDASGPSFSSFSTTVAPHRRNSMSFGRAPSDSPSDGYAQVRARVGSFRPGGTAAVARRSSFMASLGGRSRMGSMAAPWQQNGNRQHATIKHLRRSAPFYAAHPRNRGWIFSQEYGWRRTRSASQAIGEDVGTGEPLLFDDKISTANSNEKGTNTQERHFYFTFGGSGGSPADALNGMQPPLGRVPIAAAADIVATSLSLTVALPAPVALVSRGPLIPTPPPPTRKTVMARVAIEPPSRTQSRAFRMGEHSGTVVEQQRESGDYEVEKEGLEEQQKNLHPAVLPAPPPRPHAADISTRDGRTVVRLDVSRNEYIRERRRNSLTLAHYVTGKSDNWDWDLSGGGDVSRGSHGGGDLVRATYQSSDHRNRGDGSDLSTTFNSAIFRHRSLTAAGCSHSYSPQGVEESHERDKSSQSIKIDLRRLAVEIHGTSLDPNASLLTLAEEMHRDACKRVRDARRGRRVMATLAPPVAGMLLNKMKAAQEEQLLKTVGNGPPQSQKEQLPEDKRTVPRAPPFALSVTSSSSLNTATTTTLSRALGAGVGAKVDPIETANLGQMLRQLNGVPPSALADADPSDFVSYFRRQRVDKKLSALQVSAGLLSEEQRQKRELQNSLYENLKEARYRQLRVEGLESNRHPDVERGERGGKRGSGVEGSTFFPAETTAPPQMSLTFNAAISGAAESSASVTRKSSGTDGSEVIRHSYLAAALKPSGPRSFLSEKLGTSASSSSYSSLSLRPIAAALRVHQKATCSSAAPIRAAAEAVASSRGEGGGGDIAAPLHQPRVLEAENYLFDGPTIFVAGQATDIFNEERESKRDDAISSSMPIGYSNFEDNEIRRLLALSAATLTSDLSASAAASLRAGEGYGGMTTHNRSHKSGIGAYSHEAQIFAYLSEAEILVSDTTPGLTGREQTLCSQLTGLRNRMLLGGRSYDTVAKESGAAAAEADRQLDRDELDGTRRMLLRRMRRRQKRRQYDAEDNDRDGGGGSSSNHSSSSASSLSSGTSVSGAKTSKTNNSGTVISNNKSSPRKSRRGGESGEDSDVRNALMEDGAECLSRGGMGTFGSFYNAFSALALSSDSDEDEESTSNLSGSGDDGMNERVVMSAAQKQKEIEKCIARESVASTNALFGRMREQQGSFDSLLDELVVSSVDGDNENKDNPCTCSTVQDGGDNTLTDIRKVNDPPTPKNENTQATSSQHLSRRLLLSLDSVIEQRRVSGWVASLEKAASAPMSALPIAVPSSGRGIGREAKANEVSEDPQCVSSPIIKSPYDDEGVKRGALMARSAAVGRRHLRRETAPFSRLTDGMANRIALRKFEEVHFPSFVAPCFGIGGLISAAAQVTCRTNAESKGLKRRNNGNSRAPHSQPQNASPYLYSSSPHSPMSSSFSPTTAAANVAMEISIGIGVGSTFRRAELPYPLPPPSLTALSTGNTLTLVIKGEQQSSTSSGQVESVVRGHQQQQRTLDAMLRTYDQYSAQFMNPSVRPVLPKRAIARLFDWEKRTEEELRIEAARATHATKGVSFGGDKADNTQKMPTVNITNNNEIMTDKKKMDGEGAQERVKAASEIPKQSFSNPLLRAKGRTNHDAGCLFVGGSFFDLPPAAWHVIASSYDAYCDILAECPFSARDLGAPRPPPFLRVVPCLSKCGQNTWHGAEGVYAYVKGPEEVCCRPPHRRGSHYCCSTNEPTHSRSGAQDASSPERSPLSVSSFLYKPSSPLYHSTALSSDKMQRTAESFKVRRELVRSYLRAYRMWAQYRRQCGLGESLRSALLELRLPSLANVREWEREMSSSSSSMPTSIWNQNNQVGNYSFASSSPLPVASSHLELLRSKRELLLRDLMMEYAASGLNGKSEDSPRRSEASSSFYRRTGTPSSPPRSPRTRPEGYSTPFVVQPFSASSFAFLGRENPRSWVRTCMQADADVGNTTRSRTCGSSIYPHLSLEALSELLTPNLFAAEEILNHLRKEIVLCEGEARGAAIPSSLGHLAYLPILSGDNLGTYGGYGLTGTPVLVDDAGWDFDENTSCIDTHGEARGGRSNKDLVAVVSPFWLPAIGRGEDAVANGRGFSPPTRPSSASSSAALAYSPYSCSTQNSPLSRHIPIATNRDVREEERKRKDVMATTCVSSLNGALLTFRHRLGFPTHLVDGDARSPFNTQPSSQQLVCGLYLPSPLNSTLNEMPAEANYALHAQLSCFSAQGQRQFGRLFVMLRGFAEKMIENRRGLNPASVSAGGANSRRFEAVHMRMGGVTSPRAPPPRGLSEARVVRYAPTALLEDLMAIMTSSGPLMPKPWAPFTTIRHHTHWVGPRQHHFSMQRRAAASVATQTTIEAGRDYRSMWMTLLSYVSSAEEPIARQALLHEERSGMARLSLIHRMVRKMLEVPAFRVSTINEHRRLIRGALQEQADEVATIRQKRRLRALSSPKKSDGSTNDKYGGGDEELMILQSLGVYSGMRSGSEEEGEGLDKRSVLFDVPSPDLPFLASTILQSNASIDYYCRAAVMPAKTDLVAHLVFASERSLRSGIFDLCKAAYERIALQRHMDLQRLLAQLDVGEMEFHLALERAEFETLRQLVRADREGPASLLSMFLEDEEAQ